MACRLLCGEIMLIEIDDSIVSEAEKGNDKAITILKDLCFSYSHGFHYIYASKPLLGRISLLKNLDESQRYLFAKLKSKLKSIMSIRDSVMIRCHISYRTTSSIEDGCIYLNPDEYENFNFFAETVLIGENLNDCKFFTHICDKYLCCHRLWGANYAFGKIPGGGGTTVDVYDNEIEQRQKFCLCIVDSDKKYPTDVIGATATDVKNLHNNKKPLLCDYYIMEHLSEVENLLPHDMVRRVCASKNNLHKFLSLDIAFLDMKKGIVKGVLQNIKAKEYYCDLMGDFKQIVDDITNCFVDVSQRVLTKSEKNEAVVSGFGSNLLKDVLALNWESVELSKIELTSSQNYEWEEIGKRIFSWTCAPKKMRVS